MNGYLIAEEGPLAGLTIVFEEELEKNEWVLGRDPEGSDVVLEDPMVSRKHAIVRLTSEGFTLENLSSVNPATQNGMVIEEPVLLKEGDIIQIGSTFFHFTEKAPKEEVEAPSLAEMEEAIKTPEKEEPFAQLPSELHFGPDPETRWLLKVISGPNAGAEFAMHKDSTYLIGKDPNICDVVFQDLSVSRQHARITIDADENVFIEDLGSRNGVIVNGELIDEKHLLTSQDLVALGTTTFLIIDRHEARETILAPPTATFHPTSLKKEEAVAAKEKRDWKETIIPKKILALAGVLGIVVFGTIVAMITLFKAQPVVVHKIDESEKIREIVSKFSGVQYSYNQPSGKLFLIGHVLTTVNQQELLYLLHELPFIQDIENNVIVDELVWQSMNDLLSINPIWIGVSVYGPSPGKFILRGYVNALEDAQALNDYINLNFPYLDKLENQVVVEKNLEIEIANELLQKGFSRVALQLSNGEVVLSGRVEEKYHSKFEHLISEIKKLPGVRMVKNFVLFTSIDTSLIDLSNAYAITGYSKRDDTDFYVVINGRILSQGDVLDGMLITNVKSKAVFLEKDGMQYKINYNPQ